MYKNFSNSIYQEQNFGMLGNTTVVYVRENKRNRISPCVGDSSKTIHSLTKQKLKYYFFFSTFFQFQPLPSKVYASIFALFQMNLLRVVLTKNILAFLHKSGLEGLSSFQFRRSSAAAVAQPLPRSKYIMVAFLSSLWWRDPLH